MSERDPWLEKVVAELRRPVEVDPEARLRLRDRLARAPRRGSALGRVLEWLLRPRTLRVSPAAGLAGAAALCALSALLVLSLPRTEPPLAVATPPASAVPAEEYPIALVFVSPGARSVAVVGDFNDWNPTATQLTRNGAMWSTVMRLPPGRYTYSYVVDGSEWSRDPVAPPAPDEEFGRPSSVLFVQASP